MKAQIAHELSENGLVPDSLIRHGIRRMLRLRLDDIHAGSNERSAGEQTRLIQEMRTAGIAELPHKANEQHYEVPAAFYETVLGEHLKYSCGYWGEDEESLTGAEAESLKRTCRNAGIEDGMRILELGCGWGSLTLWMAEHYPESRILAVSNSRSQRRHIETTARERGLGNVEVRTCDMNEFTTCLLYTSPSPRDS